MADRSISVRLRAETADFKREIDNISARTNTAAQRIEASSVKVETARKRERDATAQVEAAEKRLADTKARGTATARQIENAEKQVTQARNAQKGATEALTAAEKKHAEVAGTAEHTLGRLAQSANQNADAWTTAGTALLGAGAAVTGLGVAALKTGIDYNTLQQQSRAALTTLLGGAEAANAQMDKLDAFARTSPFSKSTFITAQQQLLAFGVAADQVVPTLQAIQDAVAAAGGSNQQLSELVFVLAQVQAAGKITGQDLIQFGQRGVDAATLIGSQMGKTGAQIRADITAGSLDAGTAISALTAGMEQKFGGAAGNVKKTFLGATDRVKSAWRDLSSELAEGLVGKNGGGALGGLANRAADAMRDFQALPGPVKASGVALGAVTAAGLLASGMFLTLTPRIVATRAAMATLRTEMPRATRAFSVASKSMLAIGGTAAGILAASEAAGILIDTLKSGDVEQGANELEKAVRNLAGSGDISSLDAQFQNWGKVLGANVNDVTDLGGALREMLAPSVQDSMANLVGHLPGVTSYTEDVQKRFAALDSTLSSLVEGGSADEAAAAFAAIEQVSTSLGFSTEQLNTLFPQYQDALVGVSTEQEKAKTSGQLLAESMGYVGEMTEDQAKDLQKWRDAVADAFGSFVSPSDAYQAVIDKNKELAESTADATKSSEDSWEDYYDGVTVSVNDFIAQLQKQVDAQRKFAKNTRSVTQRMEQDLPASMQKTVRDILDQWGQMGEDAAPEVALFAEANDKQLRKLVKLYKRRSHEAAKGYTDGVEESAHPVIGVNADLKSAKEAQKQFLEDILRTPGTVPVQLDPTTANAQIDSLYRRLQSLQVPNLVEKNPARVPLSTSLPKSLSKFADGGPITGGTPGVDSVPMLGMPGEHVWTTAEVNNAGGQGAMYRMRGLARAGLLPKFAAGGAVSDAESEVKRKRAAKVAANAALKAAEKEQTRASRAYSDTSAKDKGAKAAAKAKSREASDDLKKARNAAKRAEDAFNDAKSDLQTLRGYRSATAEDARLNTGAYTKRDLRDPASLYSSALDNASTLLDWADSGAFSKSATKRMRTRAKAAQTKLTRAQEKYDDASSALEDLASAYDSVRSHFSGGFGLGDLLGQTDVLGDTIKPTGSSIAGSAQAYASKLKSLGTKIGALRTAGASQALIEQITALDVDEALQVADAFLADKSSITATSSALSSIDSNADAIGLTVVKGMTGAAALSLYQGAGGELGSAAVDTLALNAASIGKSIAGSLIDEITGKTTTGKGKKSTRKTAKKRAVGGFTAAGEPYLVGEQGPELFVPNVSGTVLTARQTVAATSGTTISGAGLDYDRLAEAMVQAARNVGVNVNVGLSRSGAYEVAREGYKEMERRSDPILKGGVRRG